MKSRLAVAVVMLGLTASVVEAQSRITRVSTRDVRLAAGGTTAQLTVEGADLSNVTSVRVLLNGRVVTGITSTLQRSRSTNALAILLSASSEVEAGNYQVELMSGSERIMVPVQVTIAAAQPRSMNDMRARRRAVAAATPSVSSATPTAVSLEPGAAGKTVTLSGTVLDSVSAAYVEHNGARVASVRAELLPPAGTNRRNIRLTALTSGAPLDQPLDLVLESGTVSQAGNAVKVPTPVRVTVMLPLFRFKGDAPLREPIEQSLAGAMLQFNSCGATDAMRTFMILMPGVGYQARGSVPRLESAVSPPDQALFAVAHSLKPNDPFNPATFTSLAATGHPSPIPHGVSAVRLCLLSLASGGTWNTKVSHSPGVPLDVVITVTYPHVVFRGRGMPAAPGGFPTGLNIGILWGNDVTDTEIPDLVYTQPKFEIRFPLAIENGTLVQGTAAVTFRGSAPKWSGTFRGPAGVSELMERHADGRIQQMRREIEKAFNARQTKNAIPAAIMARLRSNGVGELAAIEVAPDGTWSARYRN